MGYGPLFDPYPTAAWMISEFTNLLGEVPPEWSSKHLALVTDDECLNDECRSWEERFENDMQEPRRDLGMEQVGEEEKAAFFDMLNKGHDGL
ncbi:hypothetical protein V8E54_005447 [Elaphomyces granulatus]